ncbi:septum formation family protein [Cryobacterium sp. AP23]
MNASPAPRRRLLWCGLLGTAVLLLAGCSVVGAFLPSGETDGALAVIDGGDTDVSQLAVGDCINAVNGGILSGLDAVPCTEAHDWEVYDDLDVASTADDAGAAPGTDALVAAAEEGCAAAFLPFLGLSQDATSALGYTYLLPDASAAPAPAGDRVVHCLIGDMSGPVTGSLAGAAR